MIKIDLKPETKQLSQFGWISAFGFPLAGIAISRMAWGEWAITNLFWVLLGVGVLTFALSRINPRLVLPVYVGLMIVAAPIGMVVSFTMMAGIFYLMVSPLGLLFRLFGRDPLHKKLDRSAASY